MVKTPPLPQSRKLSALWMGGTGDRIPLEWVGLPPAYCQHLSGDVRSVMGG